MEDTQMSKKMIDLLLKVSRAFNLNNEETFTIVDLYNSQLPAHSKVDMLKNLSFGSNRDVFETIQGASDGVFDLILANIPPVTQIVKWIQPTKNISISLPKNWMILLRSLFKINLNGSALYTVDPGFWTSVRGKKFREILSTHGYYINFVLDVPNEYCYSMSSIKPTIICISRRKSNKMFIAIIQGDTNLNQVAQNYQNNKSGSVFEGAFVESGEFCGFERYGIQQELILLSRQYSDFKKTPLNNLVTDIRSEQLTDSTDSIYIRLAGNFKSVHYNQVKPNNYVQLVLDVEKVIPEYLHHYLNSELGQKLLSSVSGGNYIPHLTKSDLLGIDVYIPDLNLQKQIIEVDKRIETLTTKLDEFKKELAINPVSCVSIGEETNKMLASLETLSEIDKVFSLIRNGENGMVEFKQTLDKNTFTGQASQDINKSVFKTICAYLNTKGGTLLIGVKDNGELFGIENDIYTNDDKYLLRFKDLFKTHIGIQYQNLVNWKILRRNLGILMVECKESDKPVFLDDDVFYIRTNPATEELKGSKRQDYIEKRFKSR